ncbi:lantibiotic biosynthesis dehydratase-like protein [Pedobacter duraquae]|uniref:Lantibiotic biosynthesis dehydratase-like protein n=1 Tax=Pedobacter duraquae TaxID=425511 RepID=A0A4R6IK74_9SPHI|nr:lantibiotic biosynthesis dehydratase-like protein [Pedobacter duraquae]
MKLTPQKWGMMRNPAFSLNDSLEDSWNSLKNKIAAASPDFYNLIKEISHTDLELQPEKIRFTVWKYFNRAKFRATPFAGLATFSLLRERMSQSQTGIEIQREATEHVFKDWSEKEGAPKQSAKKADMLVVNSTLYHLGNEIRYVAASQGQFSTRSLQNFPELSTVLDLCKFKIDYDQLKTQVAFHVSLRGRRLEQLIKDMIENQMLWTDQMANITGEDYFARIGVGKHSADKSYIISERHVSHGSLDLDPLKNLPGFLDFMAKYTGNRENPDLHSFKKMFLKKFGQQLVPLSIALDPEAGIGYGSLEQTENSSDLIELLKTDGTPEAVFKISYTELHQFILTNLIQGNTVRLDEFEPLRTPGEIKLPNTLSIIYHLFEGQPVVSSAGGCTAVALLGRFSLGNDAVTEHIKNLSQLKKRRILV